MFKFKLEFLKREKGVNIIISKTNFPFQNVEHALHMYVIVTALSHKTIY